LWLSKWSCMTNLSLFAILIVLSICWIAKHDHSIVELFDDKFSSGRYWTYFLSRLTPFLCWINVWKVWLWINIIWMIVFEARLLSLLKNHKQMRLENNWSSFVLDLKQKEILKIIHRPLHISILIIFKKILGLLILIIQIEIYK
jgi:hypothetical protein